MTGPRTPEEWEAAFARLDEYEREWHAAEMRRQRWEEIARVALIVIIVSVIAVVVW